MKNKNRIVAFIVGLVFVCLSPSVFGQDEMMHTNSVTRQEFLNPAYNSFKDFASINMFSREQWGNSITGHPATFAASFYAPVKLSGLGLGVIAISEKIGLRDKLSFIGSLSSNVKIGSSSFLALGIGVGFESTAYDRERMILQYPDIDVANTDLDYLRTNIILGLFLYSKYLFCGLSSNMLIDRQRISGDWLLPGFDFSVGAMYNLSRDIIFRPELALKYYHVRDIVYDSGIRSVSFYNPIVEPSVNFLLANRLWLGTSRRFKQAQTFSADLVISEKLKIGYTYELGIGDGLNQFSSHGIRLSWNFASGSARKSFHLPSRYNDKSFRYLYK